MKIKLVCYDNHEMWFQRSNIVQFVQCLAHVKFVEEGEDIVFTDGFSYKDGVAEQYWHKRVLIFNGENIYYNWFGSHLAERIMRKLKIRGASIFKRLRKNANIIF